MEASGSGAKVKERVAVVYHCPCPDGAYAALAAYLRFHKQPATTQLDFVPHMTFKSLTIEDNPAFTPQTCAYLLDYIGPPDFVPRLAAKVARVVLLDHHKTAFELVAKWKEEGSLPTNFESHLFYGHSGATIAWDYFDKQTPLGANKPERKKLQKLFAYIEDNDLWRRKLPDSRAFAVGLGNKNVEYDYTKNSSLFLQLQLFDADKLIEAGKPAVDSVQGVIDAEIAKSFEIELGKGTGFGRCLAVLTTASQLRSEMGHQLAEKSATMGLRGIGAVCYEQDGMEPGTYKVSLRSLDEEDTSLISKHFGGGGHRNASSFALPVSTWNSWIVNQDGLSVVAASPSSSSSSASSSS